MRSVRASVCARRGWCWLRQLGSVGGSVAPKCRSATPTILRRRRHSSKKRVCRASRSCPRVSRPIGSRAASPLPGGVVVGTAQLQGAPDGQNGGIRVEAALTPVWTESTSEGQFLIELGTYIDRPVPRFDQIQPNAYEAHSGASRDIAISGRGIAADTRILMGDFEVACEAPPCLSKLRWTRAQRRTGWGVAQGFGPTDERPPAGPTATASTRSSCLHNRAGLSTFTGRRLRHDRAAHQQGRHRRRLPRRIQRRIGSLRPHRDPLTATGPIARRASAQYLRVRPDASKPKAVRTTSNLTQSHAVPRVAR